MPFIQSFMNTSLITVFFAFKLNSNYNRLMRKTKTKKIICGS